MTGARSLSVFIVSLCLLAFTAVAEARQMISIDRPEVNMRAGASTRHEALWTLSSGYPLAVVGRQGQWYKVRDFENDQGWVYRPLTGTKPHHVVKSKVANIRSGPGTGHRVIGKAGYGEVLRTLGRSGDWVRIRNDDGLAGWVARRLLWGW